MAQVSIQAVLEECRKAIQRHDGITRDEFAESGYGFTSAVAKALGVEYDSRLYGGGADWQRLEGQVKRSLDKLARTGIVVAVKPSDRAPDGTKPRWTRYYLPEVHERLVAEHDRKRREHADTRARWAEIDSKLTRILGNITTDHLLRPMLSLEQWDEILESLVDDGH